MTGRRTEVPGLPKGWTREEVIRQNGMSRGKTDVYYYSPSGKKFRSKPDLQRELGLDLTFFHYRNGKYMTDKAKIQQRNRHLGRLSKDGMKTPDKQGQEERESNNEPPVACGDKSSSPKVKVGSVNRKRGRRGSSHRKSTLKNYDIDKRISDDDSETLINLFSPDVTKKKQATGSSYPQGNDSSRKSLENSSDVEAYGDACNFASKSLVANAGDADEDSRGLFDLFLPGLNNDKLATEVHRPSQEEPNGKVPESPTQRDVEVYKDKLNFGTGKYKVSRGRAAVPKKGVRKKPVRKNAVEKQPGVSVASEVKFEENSSEEEGETIDLEYVEKYMKHIKTPRSAENEKYKKVYDTIPKLRNASPPRFTTKGVKKKRLNPEELGVRVVGKTVGNPFSSYGKKRNSIIYGNQPLKTVEEMEKYAGAAINIKKVIRKEAERVRLSSYVNPKLLEEARTELVERKLKVKEEDVDIDIETVDDSESGFAPSRGEKRIGTISNKGRRPGKTILECEDCGYKTTHSAHMKVHVLCVHKDIKRYQCQYEGCGYKCARKGSMTRHEKCVHRKDQVFKCQLCDFVSAWSISLERHIVTKHEKLRPWTCEVCKKSFGQQFTLTTHMNTVHKKVKRVRCAFCNFRSTTKVSVRAHILRMHKDEIERAMDVAEEKEEEPESNAAEERETEHETNASD